MGGVEGGGCGQAGEAEKRGEARHEDEVFVRTYCGTVLTKFPFIITIILISIPLS